MKNLISVAFCIVFLYVPLGLFPSDDNGTISPTKIQLPFYELKKSLEVDGWGSNNTEKAKLFNIERSRLGKNFEKELLALIDNDINANYWAGVYLTDKYYLKENTPLNELALKIFRNAIYLCEKKPDKESEIVAIGIVAAIVCARNSKMKEAKEFKIKVEELLKKDQSYGSSKPALDDDEWKIYDSI